MTRPIQATISSANMRHNLEQVARRLQYFRDESGIQGPDSQIFAVVKANAYGHGLATAVQAFAQADGLSVIEIEALSRLRELGWQKSLLLLEGFFEAADIQVLDRTRAITAVHNFEQIQQLAQAQVQHPIQVFLKINSGMNRLGFVAKNVDRAYQQLQQLQNQGQVQLLGFMSHFANADAQLQAIAEPWALLQKITDDYDDMLCICNSAAILRHPQCSALQKANIVRPGICLYGSSPMGMLEHETAADYGLKPAMSLKAKIIEIQEVDAGQSVGYGSTFTAQHKSKIAVVACGYADGYPRSAANGTPVVVNGVRAAIAGRVSMDMLTIDVTHIADVQLGDWVYLWGENGPSIDEVAAHSGRISYEILCALANRVPRVYE